MPLKKSTGLKIGAQLERGPGRGLSQAPPGPGWAGKRPKIDDVRSYTPPATKQKNPFDCIGVTFAGRRQAKTGTRSTGIAQKREILIRTQAWSMSVDR
jgi:hypothetical protein